MDKQEYLKRMKEHSDSFEVLWMKIVDDTNEFIESNPELDTEKASEESRIEKMVDSICLSGAWIMDRLKGKYPNDSKSLTKKVRRALGYTLP